MWIVWCRCVHGVAGGSKELMRDAQKAKSRPSDVRPRQRANLYSNYDARHRHPSINNKASNFLMPHIYLKVV